MTGISAPAGSPPTVAIAGYCSLDYATSTKSFRGIDATSILERGIASCAPGIGGIAHIARATAVAGATAEAISWVGADGQGDTWTAGLAAADVGTRGVSHKGTRSPSATMIEVGTGGTICLFDPADCHPAALTGAQREVVGSSDCVVLTVAPRHLAAEILDLVPDAATLVWAVKHDDDAYTPELITRLLGRADVVSFSAGERDYVTQDGVSPEAAVRPGALVVETRGAGGVAWAWGSTDGPASPGVLAVDPVRADDTTGAGDTFVGTLAALIARAGGLDPRGDIAALITSATRAAGDLLRARSTADRTPVATSTKEGH